MLKLPGLVDAVELRHRGVVLRAGRAAAVLLGAAVLATLTGCTGRATAAPTVTVTVAVTPSASPSPPPSCGPASGATAAAAGIASLPLPPGLSQSRWDASTADFSGYDPCAALSWSTVTLAGATASTPTAVLLFHNGSYLGTATQTAYGFTPQIERLGDDTIAVVYIYPRPGDSNADPSGRAVALYTWSASSGRVEMKGQVPPDQ